VGCICVTLVRSVFAPTKAGEVKRGQLMTDIIEHDTGSLARSAFAGLVPTHQYVAKQSGRHLAPRADVPRSHQSVIARNLFATVPIVLVSSMAMSMNLTGPVSPVEAKPAPKPKSDTSNLGTVFRSAVSAKTAKTAAALTTAAAKTSAIVPKTYKVTAGDTVSSIAGKFGLSTASVLALNGLSWKSLIFPGQVLQLAKSSTVTPPTATPNTSTTASKKYTVVRGDTMSGIAKKYKVTTAAILKANKLTWSSVIYPGQKITIPGTTTTTPKPPVVVDDPGTDTPTGPVVVNGTHLIKAGDTLSSIAKKYGISLQALLTANKLTASSTIYAGKSLVIPGVATTTPAGTGSTVTLLSGAQETNAKTIITVGRNLGVSDYGIVIALAAAMQESTMRNIDYGDRDSVGLFQQRPSAGWGSVAQLTTPSYAAQLFYGGPSNPNKGKTRGLLDISGWQKMTVTQAAQKVQVSAHPDAYAKWETSARFWLADLG
jgi:N-acetylmuramoyl-L-alanine amidase